MRQIYIVSSYAKLGMEVAMLYLQFKFYIDKPENQFLCDQKQVCKNLVTCFGQKVFLFIIELKPGIFPV